MADKKKKYSTVFQQYPLAQWQAKGGQRLAFPTIDVQESGGNRLVPRERPYRSGAKLDDTGRQPFRWTIIAIFNNTIEEPGLIAVNGDVVLYPDVMNLLVESFGTSGTGDLSVPTRGWVRARLDTYSRRESPDDQNSGSLTMNFVEDNEDDVDARAFAKPTVNANAQRLSGVTTFSQQSDGIWGDDSQSLDSFAGDLESWANAPGDTAEDIDQKAGYTVGTANRILKIHSNANVEARNKLRNPETSSTYRNLESTKELAYSTRAESRRGRPRRVSVIFEEPQSLITIAAMLKQSYDDLLAENPRLENPLYIPPRTVVWVFV